MRRRTVMILAVVPVAVSVVLAVLINVATEVLPASWTKHPWIVWSLILLCAALLGLFAYVQLRDEPEATPPAQARRVLLGRVRLYWVQGVLEKSLYHEARIALDLVSAAEQHPWDVTFSWSSGNEMRFPGGTSMTEVFDRLNQRIVILGDPGAGKTTMLLELARGLLDAAEDESKPIPVVLPLASWALKRRPIADWIVDELVDRYEMPRRLSVEWLREQRIIPLFDGLDEVAAGRRDACVTELNKYLKANPTASAVCCRRVEYSQLADHVSAHGVVTVQPLTPEQTQRFLGEAGPGLEGLRSALAADPDLWELASSPLLLSIMALAYRDGPDRHADQEQGTPRHRLYAQYMRTMLGWRKKDDYPPDTARVYLRVLANRLRQDDQTLFTLDVLNAAWLPRGHRSFNVSKGLALVPAGLLMLPVAWLLLDWRAAIVAVLAVVVALATQLFSEDHHDVEGISRQARESLRVWPPREPEPSRLGDITRNSVSQSFLVAFEGFADSGVGDKLAAFALTLVFAVVTSLREGALTGPFSSISLFVGYVAVSSMVDGMIARLWGSGRTVRGDREVPSPALRPRVRMGWRLGLAWGLVVGIGTGLLASIAPAESLPPVRFGVLLGVATMIYTFVSIGGGPLLEQALLRRDLRRTARIPWPCLPFLEFMTDCLILRKVGNGYIFVHRELLDFLADQQPAPLHR